jgi:hypothetical protein
VTGARVISGVENQETGFTMSSPVASVPIFGTVLGGPRWNADAFKAESLASKASAAVIATVHHQVNILGLAKDLWLLDGKLRSFLEQIYAGVERAGKLGAPADEQVDDESLQSSLRTPRRTCESIEYMYKRGKASVLPIAGWLAPRSIP